MFDIQCFIVGLFTLDIVCRQLLLKKRRNDGYNNDIKMILFKIISDIIVTLNAKAQVLKLF